MIKKAKSLFLVTIFAVFSFSMLSVQYCPITSQLISHANANEFMTNQIIDDSETSDDIDDKMWSQKYQDEVNEANRETSVLKTVATLEADQTLNQTKPEYFSSPSPKSVEVNDNDLLEWYISDAQLYECIHNASHKSIPNISDARNITSLNCSARGISSLRGINLLTQLKTLDLHLNAISDFNGNPCSQAECNNNSPKLTLPFLEELYLYDNQISEIPSHTFETPLLRVLSLQRNDIGLVDSTAFHELTALTTLNIAENNISTLGSDVFQGLTNLISLRLYNNNLSEFPANIFDDLVNLKLLFAHKNHFTDINVHLFINLTQLNSLDLADNDLNNIDANSFESLTNLKELRLYNNNLNKIGDLFKTNKDLEILYLQNNNLSDQSLCDAPGDCLPFAGLTKLASLNLSNNHLTTLWSKLFEDLGGLEELRVYDNQISVLENNVFASLQNLYLLYLHNNSLSDIREIKKIDSPLAFLGLSNQIVNVNCSGYTNQIECFNAQTVYGIEGEIINHQSQATWSIGIPYSFGNDVSHKTAPYNGRFVKVS